MVRTIGRRTAVRRLQRAFQEGNLTLYLGAGCSVASGVPTWDRLVTRLYVNGIVRQLSRFDTIPGLISAAGEWAFNRQVVPLEVAARRLRGYYRDDDELLAMTGYMLYGLTGWPDRGRLKSTEIRRLLSYNGTLRAVSRLCRRSTPGIRGVRAVITYNYDDLLERSLGRYPFQPVWKDTSVKERRLPIYHVHGLVPGDRKKKSNLTDIVLTEDQYNRAAENLYSWSNLVQLHALSGSVGLMVGLSLTDRNLRRILDAVRRMPQRAESYALLRRSEPWKVDGTDLDAILEQMKIRIREGWEWVHVGADPKKVESAIANLDKPAVRKRILEMIRELQALAGRREESTLAELGVHPLWYEQHEEVEQVIQRVATT
jgi:hypothetical protein